MKIDEIKTLFGKDEGTECINDWLQTLEKARIHLVGLRGSAEPLIASQVVPTTKGVHVFVLTEKEEAAYFLNDLETLLPENRAVFFPTSSRVPYQKSRTDSTNALLRAETLEAIGRESEFMAVVTYPEALSEKVVTQKHLKSNTLIINNGDKLSLDFLNELLFEYEFERVDFVINPGQFSIRGGIVDIYSFANDHPYRVELFGDEVDSLRTFDPATQLSVKDHGRITIVPNVQEKLRREARESFFEFLPEDSTVWVRNLPLTVDKVEAEFELAQKGFDQLEDEGATVQLPPEELYCGGSETRAHLERHAVLETGSSATMPDHDRVEFDQAPQPQFRKNFELLAKNLNKNAVNGIKNIIAATNSKQIERLYHIYEDLQLKVNFTPVLFPLHEGFVDKRQKIALCTDHQIFERFQRFRLKDGFREKQKAITLKELTDLQPGDYVTHIDHAVGQFAGLQKLENNGKEQEVIRLVYRDNDILFVSIHSLHRISKFVGKEGTSPKINKLGSNAWANLKQKTKKKVKEIAYDLIQLYAKRKAQQGFAFAPDTYLQHELEASFIYEDTPDQLTSTGAVKKDMEQNTPMDRLVCGDVGFGKTEIAIRAAFKAVTDSKQVAVLVPTTILALQHYKTFQKRLSEFPCNIDYINRFKTTKEQKETLRKLAEGELDIVIGTHRLVGKDVKFKDLGLMIIDEEQKFGVAVKDKLKTIKVNVDTLTLTATPIPRTLQFSLMGARDLSIINTPPPNR
ncbi:MAG: DEAD/DEAH box helicase, partial [Salibacteraceae bacterium]